MPPSESSSRALLPLWALLLLLALRLPLVATPFLEDDLHQLAFLSGAESHPFAFAGDLDLFSFFDGDEAAARERVRRAELPWRADPAQKVAFLRPVASLLMWVDHSLFGLSSLPAHLHSLLWFVAFALSVAGLYRRLLPRRAATVAFLACLVSTASLQTIRWWSARNALIAALFAVWCLRFYLEWHRSGSRPRLAASVAALWMALLAAESAVAVLGFPLARALLEPRGGRRHSLARLAPLVVAALAYLGLRSGLGYGVAGNALYLSPLAEPFAYLALIPPRLHRALGIVFLNQPTEIVWLLVPALALFALLLVVRLRHDGGERLTGWLALGSLLALMVSFASRSSLRPWTMLIPQLGAHALLGLMLTGVPTGRDRRVPSPRRLLAAALAAICLLAPLIRHTQTAIDVVRKRRTQSPEALAGQFDLAAREALSGRARRVIFLASPYQVRPPRYLELFHGLEIHPDLTTLTLSDNPFSVGSQVLERLGPSTLRLTSDEPLLRRNDLYRFDARRPLERGETVRGDGFDVRIGRMRGPAVHSLELDLGTDLDDPVVVLLAWIDGAFEIVDPPRPGTAVGWP